MHLERYIVSVEKKYIKRCTLGLPYTIPKIFRPITENLLSYSKTCVKWPLKKKDKSLNKGLNDNW